VEVYSARSMSRGVFASNYFSQMNSRRLSVFSTIRVYSTSLREISKSLSLSRGVHQDVLSDLSDVSLNIFLPLRDTAIR